MVDEVCGIGDEINGHKYSEMKSKYKINEALEILIDGKLKKYRVVSINGKFQHNAGFVSSIVMYKLSPIEILKRTEYLDIIETDLIKRVVLI